MTLSTMTRWLLGGGLACISVGGYSLDNPAVRVAPVRPGARALPTIPIAGVDYINVAEIAVRFGLNGTWRDQPKRELALSDKMNAVELEANGREITVNGRRVFLGHPLVLHQGQLYMGKIDFERGFLPLLRPELVGPPLQRPRIIALDPGHGGDDPGKENTPLGLQEKVLTLDVALRLEALLKAEGYGVVLTRRDDRRLDPDRKIDWRKRSEVANAARADLLISIHFNSLDPDTRTSGTEVFTFTRKGQRSDRSWSFGEEDDTEHADVPVNRFDAWSTVLADAMHRAVMGKLKTLDRGHKTMHSGVLRGLNCPGVLVESVFLSNDAEARLAATPEYRQQIAEAIARGVRTYADQVMALQPPPVAKEPSSVSSSPPKSP